ncbi:unnamed protein product [Coregonus sp. 'balchen']|nr:unnamed protein product [Coregonus sp. 'balchen']
MNKCNRFRMSSFQIFDLMFNQRNIHELTCLFAVVLLLTCQCLADDGYEMDDFLKREYSLTKPYQGLGSSSSSYWDLMGNAMITTEHVRLTPDLQSRQGAVWSRVPCYLRDWELQVHFKIHGHGKKNLNGDGIALWSCIWKHEPLHRPWRRVFPYVSGMVGNGTLAYEHDRDGQSTELGGCTALVRNIPHDTFLLIRYTKNRLTIQIDVDGKQEWRDCLDLPGVRLPRGYFFGASSEEEEEEELIPSVDNFEHLNKVEVQEEGMSGVQLFFTIVFSVIGVFVLGVVAVVMYGRWKENSRKRFY